MAENDQFTNGGSASKVENDPWVPLETDQFANKDAADLMRTDLPSPQNPLYQLIDSEKYIQSLENKLAKLTKNRIKQKEPTSRDIINSLAVFHEDQMRRYIDDTVGYCPSSNAVGMEESSLQASYLHRKIYPERQPLYPEEVTELLKEDLMAERFEELNVVDNTAHSGSEQKDNISGQLCAKSGAVHSGGTGEKSYLVNDSAPCEQSSETVPQDNDSNSPNASENWANFDHMNVVNERDS